MSWFVLLGGLGLQALVTCWRDIQVVLQGNIKGTSGRGLHAWSPCTVTYGTSSIRSLLTTELLYHTRAHAGWSKGLSGGRLTSKEHHEEVCEAGILYCSFLAGFLAHAGHQTGMHAEGGAKVGAVFAKQVRLRFGASGVVVYIWMGLFVFPMFRSQHA